MTDDTNTPTARAATPALGHGDHHGHTHDHGHAHGHAHSHAHVHGDACGCDHDHHDHHHGAQTPIRVMKVGRNDPCPCGSGKKYKKCCLG